MEENTTVSEEIVEENTEISSEDIQADISETVPEITISSDSDSSGIVEDNVVETTEEFTVEESTTEEFATEEFTTEESTTEEFATEGFTVEESTTENETVVEEYDTYFGYRVYYNSSGYPYYIDGNGKKVYITDTENVIKAGENKNSEDSVEAEEMEIYTEVPFLEKPLNEYSTSEGLLLLIFVLGILAFVYHIVFD